MTWHNLGGLNPNYKEFTEKHPDKTLIGMMWAMYWRFAIVILLAEAVFFVLFLIVTLLFAGGSIHPTS
jgi:hypothetical protein